MEEKENYYPVLSSSQETDATVSTTVGSVCKCPGTIKQRVEDTSKEIKAEIYSRVGIRPCMAASPVAF